LTSEPRARPCAGPIGSADSVCQHDVERVVTAGWEAWSGDACRGSRAAALGAAALKAVPVPVDGRPTVHWWHDECDGCRPAPLPAWVVRVGWPKPRVVDESPPNWTMSWRILRPPRPSYHDLCTPGGAAATSVAVGSARLLAACAPSRSPLLCPVSPFALTDCAVCPADAPLPRLSLLSILS